MRTYRHDYTLPAEANYLIYRAIQQLKSGNEKRVYSLLIQARASLDRYLAADNMIEDDDVADGWIKASDIDIV